MPSDWLHRKVHDEVHTASARAAVTVFALRQSFFLPILVYQMFITYHAPHAKAP